MNLKKILTKKGYQVIELMTLPSGHHLVIAKLNKKKGTFILDTGASNTCVDSAKSKKFKLKLKDTDHKATGAGTMEIDMQMAHKNKMKIGHWKIKKIDVAVMDLSHINQALSIFDIKIDGIIGADILQNGKGVIQYDKELLFLKQKK
jgi:predicted aspartyl protease